MRIKRFLAPDMRRAIQQVRSEHGADAVILSSRAVDGGMEIVSAVDYDQHLLAQMMQQRPDAHADAPAVEDAGIDDERADAPPAALDAGAAVKPAEPPAAPSALHVDFAAPAVDGVRSELEALKCMLHEQFSRLSWAGLEMRDPERAALARRVAGLGLDTGLAEALLAEIEHPGSELAWREIMFGIARRLRVPREDPLETGGIFALVGPTGVGKTTTVAKLAARHCLRHGRESVALISTDTVRVGAQRQLDAFGAILGVPVRRAGDADELGRLLHDLRDRRLVLIDTAGMAPRDRRLSQSLSQLDVGVDIRRLLVLAANMQGRAMTEAVRCFGGAQHLFGTVVTKLDEAPGLGAVLSVLIEQRLQAVWLSHGQRVPEDLRLARLIHLIGWALEPRADASGAGAARDRDDATTGEAFHVGA